MNKFTSKINWKSIIVIWERLYLFIIQYAIETNKDGNKFKMRQTNKINRNEFFFVLEIYLNIYHFNSG